MQIKAIFFDIDGTLVDSNDMHVLAWEEAFAGIGERFDRQVVHDQIGKGTDMLVPTLLPHLDEAAQEKLGDAHGKVFKAKSCPRQRRFPPLITCSPTRMGEDSRWCWHRRRRKPSWIIISTFWRLVTWWLRRRAATT
jgi:hypothetical protein